MHPLFVDLLTLLLLYSADPVNSYTCYSQNVNSNKSMLSEKNHPNNIDHLVILNKSERPVDALAVKKYHLLTHLQLEFKRC